MVHGVQPQMSRTTLLTQLRERVLARIQRGPLLDISIGRSARRFDLLELGTDDRNRAYASLETLVRRQSTRLSLPVVLDEKAQIFQEDVDANIATLKKIERINRAVSLYQRETGVNPLYLAFPLLMLRERDVGASPGRCIVAPLLLWPISLGTTRARQGEVVIGFDRERGLIHENPALTPWLKDHFGIEIELEATAAELSATERLSSEDVMIAVGEALKGFQKLTRMASSGPLMSVPTKDSSIPPNEPRIFQSAAVSVVDWVHQSIVNDLAKLAADPSDMEVLDTFLGLRAPAANDDSLDVDIPEANRFFIADADPAQQQAVFKARKKNGRLIHGPPGTGKSQTIVNVVIDAVARGEKVLVVCQKQAAINVVSKRLAKEGFSNLVLIVHDAMKDRIQIIEALKNQVTDWSHAVIGNVGERRNIVCAQIVAVEQELRSYNEALWTAKSHGGLSYRTILARLVSLNAKPTFLAIHAKLRPLLVKLTYQQVQEIKERIAEIAPVWERADLTDNLWRFVKSFDFSEEARLEIAAFVEAAKIGAGAHDRHIERFGELIPNINRTELPAWLKEYGELFSDTEGRLSISWIVRWRDFVKALPEARAAPQLLQSLTVFVNELKSLKDVEIELPWLERFSRLEASVLRKLQEHCEAFARRDRSWFRKLLPLAKQARRNLKHHSNELNTACDSSFASHLLQHCRHISRLHDVVTELHPILSPLGVDPRVWTLSAAEVHQQSATYLITLQGADRARIAIENCPLKMRLLDCLKEDSSKSLALLMDKFRESCIRSGLGDRARAAITPLHEYLENDFHPIVENCIVQQKSLLPVIEPLARKLGSIPPIQKFKFFRSRLTHDSRAVFDVLAEASSEKGAACNQGTAERWRASIEASALTGWKKELETTYPQLVEIPSDYYRSQVAKLEKLEEEKKDLNRKLVFERHHRQSVARENSWRGVLVTKGRGSKRLRQVVSMGSAHGVFNLRPIWLTNPETVSQIFPLKSGLFDVVIFDEASQLPPEFAVGALFRSKRAIVSGDEHQLPPTSFFQAGFDISSDSEIDVQLEELEKRLEDEGDDPAVVTEYERLQNMVQSKSAENLLTMAKPILPHSWLTIHYRSRFAELIRFSNAAFYENKLRMPTAHPPENLNIQKPIRVHRVDSDYCSDQTNPGEASAIVSHLRELWLKEDKAVPTTGIVTFNIHQRDAILDALKAEAERDRTFADVLGREENRLDGEEDIGFFVKNLENVQGDERDVIIFSTTFGKRPDGKFARFFGPLSQNGGQRRLNVAVTRARDRIEIFTSLPINEISDALTRPLESVHTGVRPRDILQLYLAYAEACHNGSHERVEEILKRATSLSYGGFASAGSSEDYDSDFEILVADVLRRNGFKVRTQVNEGEFRIDLAIVHPTENRYALGIECDGAAFHSSWSARSHDIWRQRVLESCGWKIHRVWSTDWWRNHSTQVDALIHTARHACGLHS
jgi:primosomal replication protein N''